MPGAMTQGSRRGSLSISALLNEVSIEPLQHPLSSTTTEIPTMIASAPLSPPQSLLSSATTPPTFPSQCTSTTSILPPTNLASNDNPTLIHKRRLSSTSSVPTPILPAIQHPPQPATFTPPITNNTDAGSYFYHSPNSSGLSSPTNSSFESINNFKLRSRPVSVHIPTPVPYLTPAVTEPPDLWSHPTTGMHKSNTGNIIVSSLAKAKRKRILPHQYKRLLQTFEVTDTPSSEIRSQLAAELDMTKREVQVWFQNRRAKMNRCRQQSQNGNSKSTANGNSNSRSTSPSTNTYRHNSLSLSRKNSYVNTSPPLPARRSFSFEHQRLLEAPFHPNQEAGQNSHITHHRDSVCSSLSGSSTPSSNSKQNIDLLAAAAAELLRR